MLVLIRLHVATIKRSSSGHCVLQNWILGNNYVNQCHEIEISVLQLWIHKNNLVVRSTLCNKLNIIIAGISYGHGLIYIILEQVYKCCCLTNSHMSTWTFALTGCWHAVLPDCRWSNTRNKNMVCTRWFKYDRDWFVCKQAALRSSCATLREWSHNLHPPSCSG